jgi:hypothetical protein
MVRTCLAWAMTWSLLTGLTVAMEHNGRGRPSFAPRPNRRPPPMAAKADGILTVNFRANFLVEVLFRSHIELESWLTA